MSSTIFLCPYLPTELERLIFELALSRNGLKVSTPLLLIAKRVREWLGPLMFRVSQLSLSHNVHKFPHLLPSVGHFVQHLVVGSADGKFLKTSLSSCSNLRTLVILEYSRTKCILPVLQNMPHLTRLTASFYDILHDEFLVQPFSNLTHLGILEFSSDGGSWEGRWEVLTYLPKLTHICISYHVRLEIASKVLLLCRFLKVMIATPIKHKSALHAVHDDRFVLLNFGHFDLIYNWGKGNLDVWAFCDLVVFARRRKYFLTPLPIHIGRWEKNLNDDGKQWFSTLGLNDPQPERETGGERRGSDTV